MDANLSQADMADEQRLCPECEMPGSVHGLSGPCPRFPRRHRLNDFTPAERAIWDAVQEVEKAGAHPYLTNAVNQLSRAREWVADFVDGEENPADWDEEAKRLIRNAADLVKKDYPHLEAAVQTGIEFPVKYTEGLIVDARGKILADLLEVKKPRNGQFIAAAINAFALRQSDLAENPSNA